MSIRKVLIAAALFVVTTSTAALAGPGGKHGGPEMRAKHEELVLKADANKDGKLDDRERAALQVSIKAARQAHRAQVLAKFDANKDGKLDDAERNKLRAEKIDQRFKAIDKNSDGVISKAEFSAMAAARMGQRGEGLFQGRGR